MIRNGQVSARTENTPVWSASPRRLKARGGDTPFRSFGVWQNRALNAMIVVTGLTNMTWILPIMTKSISSSRLESSFLISVMTAMHTAGRTAMRRKMMYHKAA